MANKPWADFPRQLNVLDTCGPLVKRGELEWAEVARLVSAEPGPERTTESCRLRYNRYGGTPGNADTDVLEKALAVERAALKMDRAVWEQERQLVLNERRRLERENVRLQALNNVVIRVFEEKLVQLPSFEVKPWEPRPPGRAQSANLVLGDIHGGEVVQPETVANLNAYSWEKLLERADVLRDSMLSICEGEGRAWPIAAMNLLCVGDMVTNEDIYRGQSRDIDRILVDQIIELAEALVQYIIRPCLERFPIVRLFGEWGNHGRLGKKKGQKAQRSNADYLLYQFIRIRLQQIERFKCYISQSSVIGFATPEAPDYNMLLVHGDRVKRYMSIPYYGLERFTRRWITATGVFWNYIVLGHHHRQAQIDASHGEMLINGSWVGPTEYALDNLQDTAPAKQFLFGLHPQWGMTWRYPIWLAPRPEMVQDPETLLYTPVYVEGKSYPMR